MKIKPFWDKKYLNYEYVKTYFKDEKQMKEWESVGYLPENLSMEICQVDNNHEFFEKISNAFPELKNISLCFHKLTPGHYLPTHSDQYAYYSKVHNIKDRNLIRRNIIFLEEYQIGHLLVIGDRIISHWHPGDVASWSGQTPHSAINLGVTDRYTLQVTGVYEI